MAMATIGVQVGTGTGFQRLVFVAGIREFGFRRDGCRIESRQRLCIFIGAAYEAFLRERDELMFAASFGSVQLRWFKRERVLRLVVVAAHALAAALELPDPFLLANFYFLLR